MVHYSINVLTFLHYEHVVVYMVTSVRFSTIQLFSSAQQQTDEQFNSDLLAHGRQERQKSGNKDIISVDSLK